MQLQGKVRQRLPAKHQKLEEAALKGDGIEVEFEDSNGERVETGDREGIGGEETEVGHLVVVGQGDEVEGRWREGQIGLEVETGLKLELGDGD